MAERNGEALVALEIGDTAGEQPAEVRLLDVRRLWRSAGKHCAFTDLVRFRRRWYCCFREGPGHAEGNGKIRVLVSDDALRWQTAFVAAERGVDLRDPKLSIAPGSRLMLLCGGTLRRRGEYFGRRPRARFSSDGSRWSEPVPLLANGDWLWRVAWKRRRAYGVTYRLENARRWSVALVASSDGVDFRETTRFAVPGKPNEATIRFRPDGRGIVLLRREGGDKVAWVGHAAPPYTSWSWAATSRRVGGPNFLVLSNGTLFASSRMVLGGEERMTVASMSEAGELRPILILPSGGDCGYPGMVLYRGTLWVSYYSSHEGPASIYLARIRVQLGTTTNESGA